MKPILTIGAFITALVLQTKISVFGTTPDLTVLVAYYLGISLGSTKGTLAASFIGLIEDGLAGTMVGPNLLGKGMAGFLSSLMSGAAVFRWTPLLGLVAVMIVTMMDGIAAFSSRILYHALPALSSSALTAIPLQALVNALPGIFLKPKHAL